MKKAPLSPEPTISDSIGVLTEAVHNLTDAQKDHTTALNLMASLVERLLERLPASPGTTTATAVFQPEPDNA